MIFAHTMSLLGHFTIMTIFLSENWRLLTSLIYVMEPHGFLWSLNFMGESRAIDMMEIFMLVHISCFWSFSYCIMNKSKTGISQVISFTHGLPSTAEKEKDWLLTYIVYCQVISSSNLCHSQGRVWRFKRYCWRVAEEST